MNIVALRKYCVFVCVSHLIMSDSLWPYGLYPPVLSVHKILQARILEWIVISFSRESSWPRDQTQISCIAGRFFTIWAIGKSIESIGCNQIFFCNKKKSFCFDVCMCVLIWGPEFN